MHFEKGNFLFEFIEQYSQLFRIDNWYTFTFAFVEFENDKVMGALEFQVTLLGLGFRIRWNHTETETKKDIKEKIKNIIDFEEHK